MIEGESHSIRHESSEPPLMKGQARSVLTLVIAISPERWRRLL